jgi:hypothetical protein
VLSGGRVVAHCFAGDDWRAVLDDLRRRGLVDEGGRLPGAGDAGAASRPHAPERLAAALALWESARPLPGTLGERHVRMRGVGRSLSAALRFHPAAPAAVYADAGPRRPALLAAIRAPEGGLAGVELTYLAPDGRAAAVRVPRKTVGGRPAGAAVRLDPPGPELLVGEGVFSCLSASEALGLPAWALLAVGNLRAWTPPDGVRRVLIAADRGAPGEAGAAVLARRLRRLGLEVEVRLPPDGCADWNDAARAGGGAGGEAGRVGPGGGMVPPAGPGDDP